MKRKLIFLLVGPVAFMASSCFKDLETVYKGPTIVEFNDAVVRTNAVGQTYSITSIPNSVTAGGTVITQLNLVGAQRPSDVTVRVLPDPTLTTAATTSYSLANGGSVVIPANTSFGSLTMVVGRASSTTAPVTNVVLVLDSTNADFKPSQNYKRLGYSFRR